MRKLIAPYSRALLLLTLLFAGATQSFAATSYGVPVDPAFGSGGFKSIPPYNGTYTINYVYGFVRLPLSGGYIVFSRQNNGTDHVVGTRFTVDGAVDGTWGTGGAKIYAVPAPAGNDAFVVVGIESGVERIYLAGRYMSGGSGYLTVSTFGADGSLQNSFTDAVVTTGGITEVLAAEAGIASPWGQGVLVATKNLNMVALVGVGTSGGVPGTIYSPAYVLSPVGSPRQKMRINWMQDSGSGTADMLGTENGHAVYMSFNAATAALEAETFFDLPCASCVNPSSVADAMVPAFDADALVVGRVADSGGAEYSFVSHIAGIASAPVIVWSTEIEGTLNHNIGCGPPFTDTACPTQGINYAVGPDADEAFIGATYPATVHLNLVPTPAVISGLDVDTSSLVVVPSYREGSDYQFPYITAVAVTPTQWGMARIAVDRIFAGGFEAP